MPENISAWFVALPVGAIIGWIANKVLGPTFDAWGAVFLKTLSQWFNKRREAGVAYQKLEDLVCKNHTLHGYKKFLEDKTYLYDREINKMLEKYSLLFMRQAIKDAWINGAVIKNYDQGNVFFAGMDLFFEQLDKSDVSRFYIKFKDNDQAWGGLWSWLAEVEKRNPKLLSHEVSEDWRAKQNKWEIRKDAIQNIKSGVK